VKVQTEYQNSVITAGLIRHRNKELQIG